MSTKKSIPQLATVGQVHLRRDTMTYTAGVKESGMGIENRPQEGRPIISAREAARMLRRDVRTVRRMIERGDVHGGATAGPKQRRWYVYLDQLPGPTPPTSTPPVDASSTSGDTASATIATLRAENLELRVQLASTQETAQLLIASQAVVLEAVEQYRVSAAEIASAADGYRTAADGYQQSADHYRRAATGFQSGTDNLIGVLDRYRDALSQFTLPGHPGRSD